MRENESLIKRESIPVLVAEHNRSVNDIINAYSLLQESQDRSRDKFINSYIRTMTGYRTPKNEVESVLIELKKSIWRSIIARINIREVMSIKDKEKLDRQIESGKDLPDITEENIIALIEGFSNDVNNLLKKSAIEVFKWLTPNSCWKEYKTNKKDLVGPKIIKEYVMDSYGIQYYKKQYIQALDNVFHLLDGKGVSKYPNTLEVAIQEATRAKKRECETEYFKVKWFKNGNLHIEIKRNDLRVKLNAMAGEGKINYTED